jgi:hypothetical protein
MAIWALIIAIEDYPKITSGLARQLPGTNKGASDFREWVMTVKRVPDSNIIGCADASCGWRTTGNSRQEIVDAFDSLVQRARGNAAEVYVFFSGHGIGFSEDPNLPMIDVLIGSEFSAPSKSGSACVRFQELKETLRVALGPGKHFYFIDACRTAMDAKAIKPSVLDYVWGNSGLGNATSFVLFSTAPGDVANIGSGFNTALLSALKGNGRAKVWIGAKMYVTFDSLCDYVRQALNKSDLEPEKKGPLDGGIVELSPIPKSECAVEVIGAGLTDRFILKAFDVRQPVDVREAPRVSVPFVGPQEKVSFLPDDYRLRLTTDRDADVPQIDPPGPAAINLYEHSKVRFQVGPQPVPPSPPAPSVANMQISGTPGTDLSLKELSSGLTQTMRMGYEASTATVAPGRYKAQLRDGNFKLESILLDVSPGATLKVDLGPAVSRGALRSLSKMVPTRGKLVDFSETLSDVPDWNLSLWLAVLGGARILAARDRFSKLQSLQLETFADAVPGKSILYVLAGELEGAPAPACDVRTKPKITLFERILMKLGLATPETNWKPMRPVPEVPGLFEMKLEFEPGQLLVTYAANERSSTSILVQGLANRATLLTFARDESKRQEIQQFILPIHSLNKYFSDQELYYLGRDNLLPAMRYMSTAQRLFALQAPIEGNTYHGGDDYWFDLLHHNWLDPIMMLISCYELIRRGKLNENRSLIDEMLDIMRSYFPGIADTDVIAKLVNGKESPPTQTPLLMDGLIAIGVLGDLPLPQEKLDFSGIWTSWRNAVAVQATAPDSKKSNAQKSPKPATY